MNLRTAVLARALPIAALAFALAALSAAAQTPPVRIMPVGDSITLGTTPGGYRLMLYQLLTNAGYNVDFTGTLTSNPAGALPDSDHEGHSGWRIDQIDSLILGAFAATDDPDVILVLIGTNDYGGDYDETNAINRIDALIGKMAASRPFAKIVVANLLERSGTNDTHIQNGFNAYLPGVVASHAALGRQVYFNDLRSAVPLADMPDGLHPGQAGYDKMATNWFAAITNLVGPLGATNAPALVRARGKTGWAGVDVTFSKPVADGATNLAFYTLSGGLTASAASLSADQRVVTLTTSAQTPAAAYSVAVSGVVDRTAAATPITPGASVGFLAAPRRGAMANVPEATGYRLVCSLDIPNTPSYGSGEPAYTVDWRSTLGPFDRTAYYLELQSGTGQIDFVWVSLDALTTNGLRIGVPTTNSSAFFRQVVTNMNVYGNAPDVTLGTNLATGNIEFWPSNYSATNSFPVPGASSTAYDCGDNPSSGNYGSMQLHNYGAGETILAFNRWGGTGGTADLGIGNGPTNGDWTFVQNADDYTIKTLQVFARTLDPDTNAPSVVSAAGAAGYTNVVLTFSEELAESATNPGYYALSGGLAILGVALDPATKGVVTLTTTLQAPFTAYTVTVSSVTDRSTNANVIATTNVVFLTAPTRGALGNLPAAADYTLVYSLDLPDYAAFNTTNPLYTVDNHAFVTNFTRVAYYLELQKPNEPISFIWTEVDPFTPDAAKLGVPNSISGVILQQLVTNLTIVTSMGGITTGTNLSGGNMEFWHRSYTAPNAAGVPNASATTFDWGDQVSASGGYGSMQLHHHASSQVLWAVNNWGAGGSGNNVCIGIGNNTSTVDPDWTHVKNAATYTVRTLQVYVLPASNAAPGLAKVEGGAGRTNVTVTFTEPVADTATNPSYYALSGGLSVLGAALDPVTRTIVTLTTSPQTPNATYTLAVTGVTDRTSLAVPVAPGTTASFVAAPDAGVFANIPEAPGWTLVYSLDWPAVANFASTSPAYGVDNHLAVTGFTRVAYYLELQAGTGPRQYVWAEMDPFTPDAGKIGVPTVASGALFQQPVSNLTVRSSVAGVANGTNMAGGNLEFWPWDYSPTNALGVPGASDTRHDWGDRCTTNTGGHACMQMHNSAAEQVVFAINHWGAGAANVELGIGNNPGVGNPDWTFQNNAPAYTTKRLQVLVYQGGDLTPPTIAGAAAPPERNRITLTFSEPLADGAESLANYSLSGGLALLSATLDESFREVVLTTGYQYPAVTYTVTVNNVRDRSPGANTIAANSTAVVTPYSVTPPTRILANVAEASNYQLVQHLAIPTTSPGWNIAGTTYDIDHRRYFGPFTRVAYYFELATNAPGGATNWIWVSMDPFTNDVNCLGVPDMAAGVRFMQKVTNLNIFSSHPGIVTGTDIDTGNIEFTGQNYGNANAYSVPNALGTKYDWGDVLGATFGTGGHACMQVHNHGAGGTGQVLFAYNNWGASAVSSLGIGSGPTNADWTFYNDAASYSVKNLYVFVLPENDTDSPAIAKALPSANRTNILVRFDEPVVGAAVSNFTVSGGRTVTAAEFQPTLRDVKLTVSPAMAAGASYTVIASNVADRSANANVGAATATVTAVNLPVYTRVPEAAGFELAYHLAIPTISPNYNSNNIVYDMDYRPIHSLAPFRRIAYYMELATSVGGTTNWIYTSMDTTSTNINRIGVPVLGTGAGFQQILTNMNVRSSLAGIVAGTGIQTGNIEFWPLNYNGNTRTAIPTGTSGYDWNDTYQTSGEYGSMQVHNYAANTTGQVLWAFNRWGGNFIGGSNEVGIGTRPASTAMDWTTLQNAGTQVVKNLTILAMPTNFPAPAPTPPVPPAIVLNPASRTNQLGGSTTLVAVAGGGLPLSYQWRFNGTPLAGQTGAWLTLTGLQFADEGGYDVIVTNASGAATSLVAALDVNRPPVASNLAASVEAGDVLALDTAKVVLYVFDADGDAASVTAAGPLSTNGAGVAFAASTITYTAQTSFVGTDLFAYTVTDGRGGSATGTVTVTVTAAGGATMNVVSGPTLSNGNFTVRFAGVPGYTYAVESSPSLVVPAWSYVTNLTAPTNDQGFGIGIFQFIEPAGLSSQRYYRTVYPAP